MICGSGAATGTGPVLVSLPFRSGRDYDLAGIPAADGADGLAGGVGGGADRGDLVQGGAVDCLPVRGHRDFDGGTDVDRRAGRVGGGAGGGDGARGRVELA